MKFRIKHDMPGRLRLRIVGLRHNRALAKQLETELSGFSGLRIDPRVASGSLVLEFPVPSDLRDELLARLHVFSGTTNHVIPIGSTPASPGCECDLVCSRCHPERKDPPSLVAQVVGAVVLTGYVAWVLVRQVVLKKPVSESPLSLISGVALFAAYPLLRHAWDDLRGGRHKSLFPFLAATCFLAIFLGEALTALEVIWILRIGMLLEDYVGRRSHRAIREILELTEKSAFILVDGLEVEVSVDEIRTGSTVVCHTGKKIPVDGVVIKGDALVDESAVTGRAEMETRLVGDAVYAGTAVCQGAIFIRADKVGDETYLCRILHMVETSLSN
jgi:manganese/zinc-transporting P-type ATPase C